MPSHNNPHRKPPEVLARDAGFRIIAGVDEAGRGPWAGPVVAAAVILARPIRGVRIDDSKRLSPSQRERAYGAILECATVGVGIVPSGEIDARNIRQATLAAMRSAVHHLADRPDVVLVDGNDPPTCLSVRRTDTPPSGRANRWGDDPPELSIPCWPIVGGDRLSVPIACASIIAKVTRDSLMRFYHRLFPEYEFHEHKGYGTPRHLQTLRQFGASLLHRATFQPIADALRSVGAASGRADAASEIDDAAQLVASTVGVSLAD